MTLNRRRLWLSNIVTTTPTVRTCVCMVGDFRTTRQHEAATNPNVRTKRTVAGQWLGHSTATQVAPVLLVGRVPWRANYLRGAASIKRRAMKAGWTHAGGNDGFMETRRQTLKHASHTLSSGGLKATVLWGWVWWRLWKQCCRTCAYMHNLRTWQCNHQQQNPIQYENRFSASERLIRLPSCVYELWLWVDSTC